MSKYKMDLQKGSSEKESRPYISRAHARNFLTEVFKNMPYSDFIEPDQS